MKRWMASDAVLKHPDSGALSYVEAVRWWTKHASSCSFLYRGQEKASWSVTAKIARYRPPRRMPPDDFETELLQIRSTLVKYFRSHCPFLDDVLGVPWSDRIIDVERLPPKEQNEVLLVWEMAAQHYGVPTRLIDWSTSFQIALFFAYGGWSGMQKRDGLAPSIWCLDRTKFKVGAEQKAGTVREI